MTEIERYQAQAPIGGNPAHVRLGLNDVARVANAFAESGLFKIKPKGSNERGMTPTECYAVIMAGQSMGLGPMPSMLNFHMIEGRPEMSANLQAYFLKASGKYDYRTEFLYQDDVVAACRVDVVDVKSGEVIGQSLFTMGMAKKAGLSGHNWTKYPESMLFARAISNAVAWHAPDCVPFRIYGEGEISGEVDAPGVVSVESDQPRPSKVSAIVNEALAEEEVIEDAEVVEPVKLETSFETQVRADLPGLGDIQKEAIKQAVIDARKPWGFKSIVELMREADIESANDFANYLIAMSQPAAGVTGRATGSQTEAVISDAQMRLLRAKGTEAGLSEPERKLFLKKFAQVDSSKDVKARDLDDLLHTLQDIIDGGDETKRAYLAEVA